MTTKHDSERYHLLPPLAKDAGRYLTFPKTAERYDVVVRTIERWCNDPEMNFPKPIRIGGRLRFFLTAELEEFERRCVSARHAA